MQALNFFQITAKTGFAIVTATPGPLTAKIESHILPVLMKEIQEGEERLQALKDSDNTYVCLARLSPLRFPASEGGRPGVRYVHVVVIDMPTTVSNAEAKEIFRNVYGDDLGESVDRILEQTMSMTQPQARHLLQQYECDLALIAGKIGLPVHNFTPPTGRKSPSMPPPPSESATKRQSVPPPSSGGFAAKRPSTPPPSRSVAAKPASDPPSNRSLKRPSVPPSGSTGTVNSPTTSPSSSRGAATTRETTPQAPDKDPLRMRNNFGIAIFILSIMSIANIFASVMIWLTYQEMKGFHHTLRSMTNDGATLPPSKGRSGTLTPLPQLPSATAPAPATSATALTSVTSSPEPPASTSAAIASASPQPSSTKVKVQNRIFDAPATTAPVPSAKPTSTAAPVPSAAPTSAAPVPPAAPTSSAAPMSTPPPAARGGGKSKAPK